MTQLRIAGLLCAAVSPPVFTLCGFAAVALLLCLITSIILLSTESSIYNSKNPCILSVCILTYIFLCAYHLLGVLAESYPSFPMLNQQSVLIIGALLIMLYSLLDSSSSIYVQLI